MGDRFYAQQRDVLGTCPGLNHPIKRKRNMAWDDDKKAAVIEAYENANPTPETSMEVVKDIAEEYDESPNGVRMVLSKAGVYIKKTPASGSSSSSTKAPSTRVSKAAAQEALTAAIVDAGKEVDEDVISKLTGKAAMYFVSILSNGTPEED
ncbi:MAG: hypothetical protein CL973_02175 [Euryarchaeota archaeon]|nr:hypothetical protein [Euryarchaeota archaeon]